jgi:hypothetical protein
VNPGAGDKVLLALPCVCQIHRGHKKDFRRVSGLSHEIHRSAQKAGRSGPSLPATSGDEVRYITSNPLAGCPQG